MKTINTLLSLLTVFLSIINVQTIKAQAEQDALYIFRNDGNFNAFFFGDIDHIEYSKVDTLGIEHDDYVVQEIYALNSIFRIPLSAIDSVAFVTPETKFKPGVFCPDKSIADYIVASDSLYWIRLAQNTPKSLIPKVGDKLYIEDESKYIPEGFGGLVDEVRQGPDGYTVVTSALQLTDIFEFLVAKVAIGSDSDKSAEARRRDIGEGTEISTPEYDLNIPTLNHTITIKNSTAFLPSGLPLDLELNGDLQASLSAKIEFKKFQFRTFLTITPFTGIQYYQYSYTDIESEESQSLSGGFSARAQLKLWGIPKIVKGLKIDISAGLFIEGSATALEVSHKRKQRKQTRVNVTMNNDDIYPDPFIPSNMLHPYYVYHWVCPEDTSSWEVNSTGQYSIGTGVYAKAETSFKVNVEKALNKVPLVPQSAKDKLAAWLKEDSLSFKAEIGIDIGEKLDFKAPIWPVGVIQTLADLLDTQKVYKALNTDADIGFTAYGKFSAILKYKSWGKEYTPTWEPFKTDPLGLVPNISAVNVGYADKKDPIRPYLIRAAAPITRDILSPVKVGFLVVDNDAGNEIVVDTCDYGYFRESILKNKNYTYDCVLELDPGKDQPRNYTVYPQVELWGKRLIVDQSKQFSLGPAQIDIEKRIVYAHTDDAYPHQDENEITVIPNMPNMEVRKEGDWLRDPIWSPLSNTLSIGWERKGPEPERRGVYRLIGKDRKGNVLVEDSIVVIQMYPTLVLNPEELHFDANGGTDVVTIEKTNINLETLEVTTTSDFIHLNREDKKVFVTVDKNQDGHQRSGSIKFEGEAPSGPPHVVYLSVTQDGVEGDVGEIVELLDSLDISWLINCKERQYYHHFYQSLENRWRQSEDYIITKKTDGYYVTGSKAYELGTATIKFKLPEKKPKADWYTFDAITDFEYSWNSTVGLNDLPVEVPVRLEIKCDKIPFYNSSKYHSPKVGGYYEWDSSSEEDISNVHCETIEIQKDGTRKVVIDDHIPSAAEYITIFAKAH